MEEQRIIKPQGTFWDVKPGDVVIRDFYGTKMPLTVESVEERLIITKGGWTFDRSTGIEEDEDLNFGVAYGITCSQLVRESTNESE